MNLVGDVLSPFKFILPLTLGVRTALVQPTAEVYKDQVVIKKTGREVWNILNPE